MHSIETVDALEAVIGKAPPAINLKVIDHVDASARRWLAASPLMFAGIDGPHGPSVTLAGGAAGFAQTDGATLSMPCLAIDDPALMRIGSAFGSLFLVPGIGETLRVNGHVAEVADGAIRIAVSECYVHCAKALIRSGFWMAAPFDEEWADRDAFVAASRFMALATVDVQGHADLSPKGDPAGLTVRADADALWFADRPGNRRADSFRNILTQPRLAAALLVPGNTMVGRIRGRAQLSTEPARRADFAVQGKTPLLVTHVTDLEIEWRKSPALERAELWPAAAASPGIKPASMFADHVKLNRRKGLAARVAGALVSVPGLMQKGLDKDYKDNLY